jgi:hypothetical protein
MRSLVLVMKDYYKQSGILYSILAETAHETIQLRI